MLIIASFRHADNRPSRRQFGKFGIKILHGLNQNLVMYRSDKIWDGSKTSWLNVRNIYSYSDTKEDQNLIVYECTTYPIRMIDDIDLRFFIKKQFLA